MPALKEIALIIFEGDVKERWTVKEAQSTKAEKNVTRYFEL